MNQKAKVFWPATLLCMALLPAYVRAEDKPAAPAAETPKDAPKKKQMTREELMSPEMTKKLSEMYGCLVFKTLDNPVLKLDVDAIIKGIQDARGGKAMPMTEQEYEEAIGLLQEYAYQDLAAKNLEQATQFLKENSKKPEVKELEPGKLQYMILKEGTGAVVTEEMRPTIKYTGKYIDGTTFGSSEANNNGVVTLSLKQTVPGFRKGVLGMKVGEKRKIFIHPELGYGTSGQLLPNALLIFEVEVTDVQPEPKKADESKPTAENETDDALLASDSLYDDALDDEDDVSDDDTADDDSDDDDGDDPVDGVTGATGPVKTKA